MSTRKLIMPQSIDEVHRQRKQCFLSYGRALLTVGLLIGITLFLYFVSQDRNDVEPQSAKIIVIGDEESEALRQIGSILNRVYSNDDALTISDLKKLPNRNKRTADNHDKIENTIEKQTTSDYYSISEDNSELPKLDDSSVNSQSTNSINNAVTTIVKHQSNLHKRYEPGTNKVHLHPNGAQYLYFKGYKCVPFRRPPLIQEPLDYNIRTNKPLEESRTPATGRQTSTNANRNRNDKMRAKSNKLRNGMFMYFVCMFNPSNPWFLISQC